MRRKGEVIHTVIKNIRVNTCALCYLSVKVPEFLEGPALRGNDDEEDGVVGQEQGDCGFADRGEEA